MKHVYFVRHGETIANRKHIHQGPHEPLSLMGRKQAAFAGQLLKQKNIDTLICSTYTRARETAEIISVILHVPFTQHDSIKEFRRPNHLYNKSHYSFGSFLYLWRLFVHKEDPKWDDDGAENMFAVRNRVYDAQQMLSQTEGETLAVVSHAIFMDMFITLACQQKKLTVIEFISGLLNFKKTPNTGIIHLTYDEQAPEGVCQWQLVEYIDPRAAAGSVHT